MSKEEERMRKDLTTRSVASLESEGVSSSSLKVVALKHWKMESKSSVGWRLWQRRLRVKEVP